MNWRRLLTTNFTGLLLGQDYDASQPRKTVSWKGPHYARRRQRDIDLLRVNDQLEALIRVNAPLVQGLTDALSLDAPNSKVEAVLLTLRDDLNAGLSLAEAMRLRPRFYPGRYVDLIAAGERSGTLAEVFERLSRDVEQRLEQGSEWIGALAYAALVVTIQLCILAFIALKVGPVFSEMLEAVGGPQPPWTLGLLLDMGSFIEQYWSGFVTVLLIYLFVAAVVYFLGGWSILASALQWFLVRIPMIRGWMNKQQTATAGFYLARLTGAGVPLVEALEHVDRLSIRRKMKDAFGRLRARLERGEPLREAIVAARGPWPASFASWAALGESSGMLPETFAEMADYYHEQCEKARAMASRMVAPLAILAGGALALFGTASLHQAYVAMLNAFLGQL